METKTLIATAVVMLAIISSCLILASGDAADADTTTYEDETLGVTFELSSDGTAVASGLDGSVTELVLPGTVVYEGSTYTVTGIGMRFAYENTNLTSITIPASVTSIEIYAFYGCNGLETVTFETGSELETIGGGAFQSCTSLASFTIPETVTTIDASAFRSCTSLASIVIPASVTSIETATFRSCTSLASIVIPELVTSIGNYAFYGCSGLETVTFEDGSHVTSIGNSAFYSCTSLKSIVIPESVTSIGNSAFQRCTSLTSINIPESVTSIGTYPFSSCSSLEYIWLDGDGSALGSRSLSNITSETTYLVVPLGEETSFSFDVTEYVTLAYSIILDESRILYHPQDGVDVTLVSSDSGSAVITVTLDGTYDGYHAVVYLDGDEMTASGDGTYALTPDGGVGELTVVLAENDEGDPDDDATHELVITSVSYEGGWIYYSLDTGCAYVMVIIEDTDGNTVYLGPSPDPNGQPYSGSFYHELDPGDYVLYVQGPDCGAKAREGFIVSDETVAVTGVSLGVSEYSLEVGETYTLHAFVTPSNATNRSVTWSSSDESVATVSNGVVTGVSAGTAVITVTTVDGGYTATCTITVQSTVSSEDRIRFGSTIVTIEQGYTVSIPIDVGSYTSADIGYSIDDPTIAEVKGLSIGNGVSIDEFIVEGLQVGTTTLRMWVIGNESIAAQCTISIEEAEGDPCTLYYFYIKFVDGDTSGSNMSEEEAKAGFWAYGEGSTAKEALEDAANRYEWQLSFDETYYSGWLDRFMGLPTVLNDDGTYTYWVQYHWNGTAWEYNNYALGYLSTTTYQYIALVYSTTALDHNYTIDLGVTPDDIPDDLIESDDDGGETATPEPDAPSTSTSVTGVTLDAEELTLRTGWSATLTATVSPSNATNRSVTWSSSDESVATVSNGVVTGVSAGTAIITVTTVDGGYTATCTVTVVAVQEIEMSVDSDGGSVVLTEDQVQEILDAVSQAEDAPGITLTVTGTEDSLDVTIPSGLTAMATYGATLVISSEAGTMIFDEDSLRSLAEMGDSLRVTISVVEDVATAPEGSTVFEISVYVDGEVVDSFSGMVTVSLPYETDGEGIQVWFVEEDGLTEADFEFDSGIVIVKIDSPSTIAVGAEEEGDEEGASDAEDEDESDDTLLYVAIIVVIVIVVIAAVLALRRRT